MNVVRIKLRKNGYIDDYKSGDLPLSRGDLVILQMVRNQDFGVVVAEPGPVDVTEEEGPENKVIRKCTEGDLYQIEMNTGKNKETLALAAGKVHQHNLKMKLVSAEYSFDRSKVTIYFTAEGRIDFRNLVKDLAGLLRARIQLEQIGARDHAKKVDGFGVCGRRLCCAEYLNGFSPVSIKMAKEQNIAANPGKLSGLCGRLMCCLRYEYKQYLEVARTLPRVGDIINTKKGRAKVLSVSPMDGNIYLENEEGGQFKIEYKKNLRRKEAVG